MAKYFCPNFDFVEYLSICSDFEVVIILLSRFLDSPQKLTEGHARSVLDWLSFLSLLSRYLTVVD